MINGQNLLYSIIRENGGELTTTFDELAKKLNLSKGRVVYIRNRLVDKKIIESKCINPTGRKKQIVLTIIKKGE